MAENKKSVCCVCGKMPLEKNEIGICKKYLGRKLKKYYCLDCLAEELAITKEDLIDRIEFFKNEGCTLFD